MTTEPSPIAIRCPACGTEVPAALRACPACHRLVHAETLNRLAADARRHESERRPIDALRLWREALELLPPGTQQHAVITAKLAALGQAVEQSPAAPAAPEHQRGRAGATAAAIGGVALLLWKFKFIVVFLATKAKFLLMGLTKGGTILTMLLSFGVYWAAFGWPFAAGLVVSIYIHEIGHVYALHRLGFPTPAPMFIPGLGAVIRLRTRGIQPREDARIGLAGPIWGAAAAIAAYGLGLALDSPILLAIAKLGAWINLFNLLPVWQLDGGRGFRALSRRQAWLLLAVVVGMWFTTSEGLLFLIGIAALMRTFTIPPEAEPDRRAFLEFSGLVILLSAMTRIAVPTP